ncbi:uncharacterized protein LAESUDRAFT_758719 [Laetiporus sulphureus 93-53]|uniref:BTB domain-containing protein n=1 Tax=Laetiporus sulphureus 93-53 TaxID=1314785 RepID=A0A165ELK8_9APHY|nr:uncharacterized protein LAESUDRAFT_758719 [Laetiporus sulphureus 93-53]KZT07312.1 hypothetical protein LAESUDRAFT_758719 [Laetiporus sulphureus 93-53]
MSNADVILRSADLMDFRVHTVIISMISTVLGELLATRSVCEERRCGLPIIPLLEDGATLFNLLQLAYPVHESATGEATMGRIDQWAAIFAAARKYKMNGVAQTLLKRFTCLGEEDPLSAYFIACRFGLQEQAIEAARLDRGLLLQHDRSPEMERASAGIYFRLLEYQRHCIQAVNAVILDQVWWTRKARSLGDSAHPQCLTASSDNSDDQSPCWILAVARALQALMPGNGFRGNVRRASSSGILNFMIVFKKLQTPIPFCDSCASLEVARSVHEIWPLVEQDVDAIVSQVPSYMPY